MQNEQSVTNLTSLDQRRAPNATRCECAIGMCPHQRESVEFCGIQCAVSGLVRRHRIDGQITEAVSCLFAQPLPYPAATTAMSTPWALP